MSQQPTTTATPVTYGAPVPVSGYPYGYPFAGTRSYVLPAAAPVAVATAAPSTSTSEATPVTYAAAPASFYYGGAGLPAPLYGGATRSYVLPAAAPVAVATSSAAKTSAAETTTTTTTTTTAAPVVLSSAPYYYGLPLGTAASAAPIVAGTRSFVLPAAATTATTSTTTTEVAATSATPVTYAAAPASFYYGYPAASLGATRSFVLPATTTTTTTTETSVAPPTVLPPPAPVAVPASFRTRSYNPAAALPVQREVLFEMSLERGLPAKAPEAPVLRAGDQPYHGSAPAPAPAATTRNVSINVVSASGLPTRFTDKTDPYVKINIGGVTQKTSYKDDAGANATWNETLAFAAVPNSITSATLEVFDKDVFTSDDFLGSATFNLVAGKHTITISDKGKNKGSVVIEITLA